MVAPSTLDYFTVEVVHPCRKAEIIPDPASPLVDLLQTTVLAPVTFAGPTMTHKAPYETLDCGTLKYELTHADSRLDSFLTLTEDTGEIHLNPTHPSQVDSYTLTLAITNPTYPESIRHVQ